MYQFSYSNIPREKKVYGYNAAVRSCCRMCHGGCGVIVYLKDGRIAKIAGDPECPINHGTLCSKGLASAQLVYHPDRLTYPVKRTANRGGGNWQRISWDEALNTIAEHILSCKKKYGAESIVLSYGTARENGAMIYRFANLLGSPNVLNAAHFCYGPRIAVSTITCGGNPVVDYERHPRCVLMWGNNVVISNPDCYKGESFSTAIGAGAKLIVVDPRMTRAAARADLWLQLRPGTDAALALGIINVIITENLYDREFVESFVYGWPEFVGRVREYPLEYVEKITGVKKEQIMDAARLFANTKPAAIQWGVAIEQQINSTDNNRLLIALLGITGNIDIPGGQVLFEKPPIVGGSQLRMNSMLSGEQAEKRLGGDRFRLASQFTITNPKSVWDAVLEEKPYPVKMMFIISSNPLVTATNSREVYRALERVGFLAVSDFFMTPTAELADIVLPAATWLEMDWIGDFWKRHSYILPRRKVVQIGECRSDHEMLNDLAHRVGQGEFWWDNFEEALDFILSPMGITWKDFSKMAYIKGKVRYRKHKETGFSTPTGKFELYSTALENMGYDPLPQYREGPESPLSTPELYREYPYILITGARQPGFFHSENRQLPWLRELHKDPVVEIHPQTAEKEHIREGDWVVIESPRGKVKQRARLTSGIDPNVVAAQHAWWFPENKDPGHGWDESNINILTDNAYETCNPAMGSANARTFLCRIYPEIQKKGGGPLKHEGAAMTFATPDSGAHAESDNPSVTGIKPAKDEGMRVPKKHVLVIDNEACWGCKACEVACKQENNTPDGVKLIDISEDGPKIFEGKQKFIFQVNVCKHCDEPPCAKVCLAGAIRKRDDGIVLIDYSECTGCMDCIAACPYNSVGFDLKEGVARKCNLCFDRIDKGLIPACADNACPAHCINFY